MSAQIIPFPKGRRTDAIESVSSFIDAWREHRRLISVLAARCQQPPSDDISSDTESSQ